MRPIVLVLTLIFLCPIAGGLLDISGSKLYCNRNYLECFIELSNSTGEWILEFRYNTSKTMNVNLMMLMHIFKFRGTKKIKALPTPKLNYCDMRAGLGNWPIISQIFRELQKNGNSVPKCPIRPGNYILKNFAIENLGIINFFPNGKYFLNMKVSDENLKPIDVMRYEVVAEKMKQ